MAGFLVGLVSGEWGLGIRYEHGYLKDAVLAALDRDREGAGSWVQADWFEVWDRRGESVDADPRVLLLQWVGDRLTAAHRMSCPTFLHSANETEDERRAREATEREYCDREEASIQRAQNFGKRIAGPDREGICVPASYSLNRALVLESQEKGRPGRPRPRGVTVKTTPARAACGGSFQAQRKRWPPLGRSPKVAPDSEMIRQALAVGAPVGPDRDAPRHQVRCVSDVIDGRSRRSFQVPFRGDFEALERPHQRLVNTFGRPLPWNALVEVPQDDGPLLGQR